MDPNSAHQIWSLWVFEIYPMAGRMQPGFQRIKSAAASYGRFQFGGATQMKVEHEYNQKCKQHVWRVSARTEGHPVHDATFRTHMIEQWTRWAEMGFGPGTRTVCKEAKLEAGDRQDGSPRDQLIIIDGSSLPNLRKELAQMREERK